MSGDRSFSPLEAAGWIALAIYLALVVGFAWNPTPPAQVLAALGIVIACTHAALFYGWKDALVLLAICLAITFAVENIGAATGFPFGHYHFEVGSDLIHVGAIPVIVGPLWFGMGYISWIVAATLLGGADRRLNGSIASLRVARRRGIRDDAVGCGDGPARGDHFKSLDMA
ncbi:MAG: carotenoid biosynthesis protein [Bradyrhizobium sp.]